jgi:GT2 family glycosyltransferase
VTHHSAAVIAACLQSIRPAARIVVVDNASDDDTCAIVARAAPQAELLRNAVGVGFGNAANQALARVETEFALLANPDSILRDDAVATLVAAADAYPEAALVAPALMNADGSPEPSHDAALFVRPTYANRKRTDTPDGTCCADYVSAAVVLVRMAALRPVGGFDRHIFLYYEDDDLCLRLRAAGHSLLLVPDARVDHVGGGSVRPGPHYYWEKFFNMAWSRLYIEEKYRGRGSSHGAAWAQLLRYGPKALGYALLFNRTKAWRDAARFCGTAAYLLRLRPARSVPRRPRLLHNAPDGAR